MIVFVCLDDNNGMLFCGRRQSRDRVITQDILTQCEGSRLWMDEYSRKLFEDMEGNIITDIDFLRKAEQGEFCFVENQKLEWVKEKIEKLVIYRWNRKYPENFSLDLDLTQWNLDNSVDMIGNSHEKITKETYGYSVL